MLTQRQLSQILRVSYTLLSLWQKQGYFPRPDATLRPKRWKVETIRKFFREKNVRIAYV